MYCPSRSGTSSAREGGTVPLRFIWFGLLALGVAYAPAAGQIAPDFTDAVVNPAVLEVLAQLDDPSFAVREEATRRLVQLAADQSELYPLLSRADLSAEQRLRLLEVVRQKLLLRPRGALGISMPTRRTAPAEIGGVEIGSLLPGMPAEKVLQVGDCITHADGRPVGQIDELQMRVQEKEPGDDVLLTVRRPRRDEEGRFITDEGNLVVYDTFKVTLSLGSAEELQDPSSRLTPDSPVLIARRREAQEAARRFSPEVRYVGIRNLPGTPVTDEEIERHPLIQRILSQRQALTQFGIGPSESLRRQWRDEQERLRELMTRPDLTARQRHFHQRLYDHYSALILP
ncbi:MAG: PDZ domain-containing protein [Phycisphaerales bacterium]|nr:MAG: PDZ domain-containing protein [Phycisphaerales bacterium]